MSASTHHTIGSVWCCASPKKQEEQTCHTADPPVSMLMSEVNLSLVYPSHSVYWHLFRLVHSKGRDWTVITHQPHQNVFHDLAEALVQLDVQYQEKLVVHVACRNASMAQMFQQAYVCSRITHRAHSALSRDMESSDGLQLRATTRNADVKSDVEVVIWPDFEPTKEPLTAPPHCSQGNASLILICHDHKSMREGYKMDGFNEIIQLG
jgi:hypothetical protein